MPITKDSVLHDRYKLAKRISATHRDEAWLAIDPEGGQVLAKLWPYEGEQPNEVIRALWDRELRNLFRLSSSPDADAQLVVLRDAGIDKQARCFVMVLSAPGFESLRTVLENRARYDWLRDMRQVELRVSLWRAVRELAEGLGQLHRQQMLHRALSTVCIFLDSAAGPESMRLGGFEWTLKVGQGDARSSQSLLFVAPETSGKTKYPHTFESDWYHFGLVAAQLFAGIDATLGTETGRQSVVLAKLAEASQLSDLERDFLSNLLESKPALRLSRQFEIIKAIDEIIARLDQPARFVENSYLALAVLLGPNRALTDSIRDINESILATDTEAQRLFIQRDLQTARLIARPGRQGGTYFLQGNRLVYYLKEYAEPGSQPSGQWELGFCDAPGEIRYSAGVDSQVEIRRVPIRVFRLSDIRTDPSIISRGAVSWRPFLPQGGKSVRARERQQRFHEFFRITNQIELLFRDAEIFPFERLSYEYRAGIQRIVIQERGRTRSLPSFAEVSGGMVGFLVLQSAEKRNGDKVYIGTEESVYLDRSRGDLPEFWTILNIDEEKGLVALQRAGARLPEPPKQGYLRSFDMFGQISLIRRRKRAIERLQDHNYLLKAIRSPDSVYIDTADFQLPIKVDQTKVDDAKLHALHNIWRTRPIFALQGPPGTGKTTLVANLLGQIFADDSVAQVLVTAQAHSAVDVLRDKVSNEIFNNVDEPHRPLAVRLSRAGDESLDDVDSIPKVTLRILKGVEGAIQPTREIEAEWLNEAKKARRALEREPVAGAPDLCELVKRSASIVYSTTTAGDLEELADLTQSFDWSLIEEAGKAHGFDLVLPLHTGHRWVLIGDQNQLPPYRFQDFRQGLLTLDDTVTGLLSLPERAGGLVDVDLLQSIREMDQQEKAERRDLWLTWLPVFGQLYRTCTEAIPAPNEAAASPHGVLASMLYQQHRMHPTIAGLISAAYYDRPIESLTVNSLGKPLERVVHPFVEPTALKNSQIVWIDVDSSDRRQPIRKQSREEVETSAIEVDTIRRFLRALQPQPNANGTLRVAVLSPYRRQVLKLTEALKEIYSDRSLRWLAALKLGDFPASTVDSFQGDQADVVVVSLVRQNDKPPGEGLGFLREASRMNVLFSRAERLLVLVGNWHFFKFQVQNASRDKNQPLGHWRLALEYIESCVKNGSACVISGKDFSGVQL